MSQLLRDVDSYNRDLLFQRYEVAAKKITPSQRLNWLSAMKAQNLHFTEIEVVGTQTCAKENDQCVLIDSEMQWYTGNSPSVNAGHVTAVWQYDMDEKAWLIVEQSQN